MPLEPGFKAERVFRRATTKTRETQAFYDGYWPRNLPDYHKTREYVAEIVPAGRYRRAA